VNIAKLPELVRNDLLDLRAHGAATDSTHALGPVPCFGPWLLSNDCNVCSNALIWSACFLSCDGGGFLVSAMLVPAKARESKATNVIATIIRAYSYHSMKSVMTVCGNPFSRSLLGVKQTCRVALSRAIFRRKSLVGEQRTFPNCLVPQAALFHPLTRD
jgi:hypothetical protein